MIKIRHPELCQRIQEDWLNSSTMIKIRHSELYQRIYEKIQEDWLNSSTWLKMKEKDSPSTLEIEKYEIKVTHAPGSITWRFHSNYIDSKEICLLLKEKRIWFNFGGEKSHENWRYHPTSKKFHRYLYESLMRYEVEKAEKIFKAIMNVARTAWEFVETERKSLANNIKENTLLYKWDLQDKEIIIFCANNKLYYLLTDKATNGSTTIPIELHGRSISEAISHQKQFKPLIQEDGTLIFVPKSFHYCWILRFPNGYDENDCDETKELEWMIGENGNFIWRFLDKDQGTVNEFPFENMEILKDDSDFAECLDYESGVATFHLMYRIFEKFKSGCSQATQDECEVFLSDFKPIYVQDQKVVLLPNIVRSKIDPTVFLSKYFSSVTLICASGSNSKESRINSGNHAELLIEEIRNGKYTLWLAHFFEDDTTLESSVEVVDITEKKPRYFGRTKAYLRPSKDVSLWLQEIKKEESREISPPKLDRRGRDGLFVPEGYDSCFTWARDRLKRLKIDLGESIWGGIVTVTSSFTDPDEFYENQPFDYYKDRGKEWFERKKAEGQIKGGYSFQNFKAIDDMEKLVEQKRTVELKSKMEKWKSTL